jgi:hypothetical protein
VLRVGVKEGKIAVGELHHDLAVNVRTISRILRPPGVGQFFDRLLQWLEMVE